MGYLLFDVVSDELVKVMPFSVAEIYGKLEQPPEPEMGDVAFPCFSLSRILKKSPQNIAEEMRVKILSQVNPPLFSEVKVAGGYLNIFLNKVEILKRFHDKVKDNSLIALSEFKDQKVTIEHTSINPNASPHIGRARNAMIGDASVRLLRFLGCDVKVRYFVNDIGKQIALLVYFTKNKPEINFNDLLDLYVTANEQLKNEPDLEKEVFSVLNRMENGDEEVFADFSRIVGICIKGQKAIFNEFGIHYDQFDYESQYVQAGKANEILSLLKKTNRLFEDDDGRLVLNLEEFNINSENPYLPLTRKDKTSLYPLRDICYSIDKANENASRNIIVLGEDQRIYGRQINAALSLLGFKGAEIIVYSFVLLPDGKMSTRAGQVVLLEDLMRETVAHAKATIAEHRKGTSSEELLLDEKLPKLLAYGAIKYSILKCDNEKNVIFDKDSALNFQGDTSVYIQYSFVRIRSMLRGKPPNTAGDNIAVLTHPLEWEIVKKILFLNQVLSVVSQNFNFAVLCRYLYELCQLFSRWYRECQIKNAGVDLRDARLFLASVVANIIKDGLQILGIEAPEKI
jgi:arginyl-tRNA synthetase